MIMTVKQGFLAGLWWLIATSITWGQGLLDVSFGSSFQDDLVGQITYSQQFSKKFRAGIGVQYGAPSYRFVGAKPFQDVGYSYTIAAPLTLELVRQEKIQLLGLLKLGVRFQGVNDPLANDIPDSIFASTAVLGEIGLLVNVPISERVNIQSGVSFPIVYEVSPNSLLEYQFTSIHAGVSYALKRQVFFFKGNMGAAFGASGDTYKFIWMAQAGVRFQFGESKSPNTRFIETSF